MWLWVLAAGIFALAALLFFLLYRRAKLALAYSSNPAHALTVDGVAALLSELEATGEIIVERLEVKQREIDQLLQLLDAKQQLLNASLALRAGQEMLECSSNSDGDSMRQRPPVAEQKLDIALGEKQQSVLHWQQQGLDPVGIARETGLKLDEVRLILSLFRSNA